jgi:hypothetical protein
VKRFVNGYANGKGILILPDNPVSQIWSKYKLMPICGLILLSEMDCMIAKFK